MKHTLLVGLILTAVSTAHGMDNQDRTKKNTPKNIQRNKVQKNQEIHNLFKEGRHKEAAKKIPSKPASLVQFAQATNDPQFKLWVESKTKQS